MVTLDISKASQFLSADALAKFEAPVAAAQKALEEGTCKGNDFLGWMHLPTSITPEFIAEININSPAVLHSLYLSTDVIQRAVVAQRHSALVMADKQRLSVLAVDGVLRAVTAMTHSNAADHFLFLYGICLGVILTDTVQPQHILL